MATMVKMGTKRAEELIYDMGRRHYKGTTLYDVYGKASKKKRDSWETIVAECNRLHGQKLHITGASCHNYSCIYAYPVVEDSGKINTMIIRKETVGNTYELEMPVDEYIKRYGI